MASRSAKQTRYGSGMMSSAPKPTPSILNSTSSAMSAQKPAPRMANSLRPLNRTLDGKKRLVNDPVDVNGNRLGPRPRVGEADPGTRRDFLNQRLGEDEKRTSVPPPAMPQKKQPADTSGRGGRARSKKIDDLVSKMQ